MTERWRARPQTPRALISSPVSAGAVSSHLSHHPYEVLLAQFSLYVHKGGIKSHGIVVTLKETIQKSSVAWIWEWDGSIFYAFFFSEFHMRVKHETFKLITKNPHLQMTQSLLTH